MAPKLYYNDMSPPVRSVLLTAKALGLELELESINLFAGEHLTPEFLKKNPLHTVPTLEDDGFYLWDSHAINTYLCDKYGKNDSLYPKDMVKRGLINQRLFFNASVVQNLSRNIFTPIFVEGVTTIPKRQVDDFVEIYATLETFLEGREYMVGDSLTIADLTFLAAISVIVSFIPVTQDTHPKLSKWLNKMQKLPYYIEANQVGSDKFVSMIKTKLA